MKVKNLELNKQVTCRPNTAQGVRESLLGKGKSDNLLQIIKVQSRQKSTQTEETKIRSSEETSVL